MSKQAKVLKLAPAPLPPGFDPFIPVPEFTSDRYPSGKLKYCSRFHLYELKKKGLVEIVYSGDKAFVDMASWFAHFADQAIPLCPESPKQKAKRKARQAA